MIDKDNHYIPDEPELRHVGGNTAGGNPQTFYPHLWAWLVWKLNIKTVVDVGCGEGHALKEFHTLGCNAVGIDGSPRNVEVARALLNEDFPRVWHVDLTQRSYVWKCGGTGSPGHKEPDRECSLIWCCEVVNMIEIQYIRNVLETLSDGTYLALTHALPGQDGYHQVNCRPPEFWHAALLCFGMTVNWELTEESKKYGHHYWTSTGTIYQRMKP